MTAKKKPQRRTMWFNVAFVHVIDRASGEVLQRCKALVVRDGITRRMMKARGYRVGDELKADVRKGRNYQQFKTAHGLGMLCIEQIDRFAEFGTDAHAALKALQRESGIACEVVTTTIEAKPIVEAIMNGCEGIVGKARAAALKALLPQLETLTTQQMEPLSLSYETMDAGAFTETFDGLCNHVLRTYWPDLDEESGRAKISKWISENAY